MENNEKWKIMKNATSLAHLAQAYKDKSIDRSHRFRDIKNIMTLR